jgi:hypothetical protein
VRATRAPAGENIIIPYFFFLLPLLGQGSAEPGGRALRVVRDGGASEIESERERERENDSARARISGGGLPSSVRACERESRREGRKRGLGRGP